MRYFIRNSTMGIKQWTLGGLLSMTLLAGNLVVADAYSPGVGPSLPRQPLFGDLHLHSRASADANAMGNISLTAADAYRFASGEQVNSSNGLPVRLRRPLDFLAVTDHAEFLGILNAFAQKHPLLMNSPLGRRWGALPGDEFLMEFVTALTAPDPVRDDVPDALEREIWDEMTHTADEFYKPGQFTTFSAYEWTSAKDGNNLHRCVIYRDGADVTSTVMPFSSLSGDDPEQLWAALDNYERQTGGRVMAIPHNGNLSNGIMWDTQTLSGAPLDKDYATRRMRWEPVAEVTQVKGDSETHPVLSPTDEFADFERWDRYNIMNTATTGPENLPGSYARSALKRGLALEQALGVNPYQFGMIGSTDSHTGLATAAEDNFFGKFANSEPGVRTSASHMAGLKNADWELGASGLAAVWAHDNTREAIFDALARKEIYATTGSRILLRFFAGWQYQGGEINSPEFTELAYERGVPMGAELGPGPRGKAPRFLLYALKDPDGPNLARLQVVKGWLDKSGESHERVYDVAQAREPDAATTKVPQDYSNAFGAAELKAEWQDPDFDTRESAFYYARVIEIPRLRWTMHDQTYFKVPAAEEAPVTLQDRAYSSPVWYRPHD